MSTCAWCGSSYASFREGATDEGEGQNVYYDTSVEINGRSPWAIEYGFEVDARAFQGKCQTWDGTAEQRRPGQPVHVVYLETDPEQNALYPPVQ